jgi:hypothetical protein
VLTAGSTRDPQAAKRGPAEVLLVQRKGSLLRVVLRGVRTPRSIFAGAVPRPPQRGARASQGEELGPVGGFLLGYFFKLAKTTEELEAEKKEEAKKVQQEIDRSLWFWSTRPPSGPPPPPTCRELRQQRESMRSALDRIRRARDRAKTPEQRADYQALFDELNGEIDELTAKIRACGNPPPGVSPPALAEDFATSWAHGTGRSRICVYVTGAPGQTGTVTVPGTAEPPDKDFVLNNQGRSTVSYEIATPGTYSIGVRWRQANGTFSAKNGSVNVGPGADSAPPPGGFSACSPP